MPYSAKAAKSAGTTRCTPSRFLRYCVPILTSRTPQRNSKSREMIKAAGACEWLLDDKSSSHLDGFRPMFGPCIGFLMFQPELKHEDVPQMILPGTTSRKVVGPLLANRFGIEESFLPEAVHIK